MRAVRRPDLVDVEVDRGHGHASACHFAEPLAVLTPNSSANNGNPAALGATQPRV